MIAEGLVGLVECLSRRDQVSRLPSTVSDAADHQGWRVVVNHGARTGSYDLRAAFEAQQAVLTAQLGLTGQVIRHPTTIGNASEGNWQAAFRDFLPSRYSIGSVFVGDADGRLSEQIDLAVYDGQYAPNLFTAVGDVNLIPAESVYAVFEIKQKVTGSNLIAAAQKAATVRELKRYPGKVHHAGGVIEEARVNSKPILAGILARSSYWEGGIDRELGKRLRDLQGPARLDLGVALDAYSFSFEPPFPGPEASLIVERTKPPVAGMSVQPLERAYDSPMEDWQLNLHFQESVLIYFLGQLFKRLQPIATAHPIDVDKYFGAVHSTLPRSEGSR